jgi:hypothetical protein
MPYAEGTNVSVDRSMSELQALLRKYGASGFAFGSDDDARQTRVQFKLAGRVYRLDVAHPDPAAYRVRMNNGQYRSEQAATNAAAREEQRHWRSLVLVIKAILVGVADGVLTAEDALMAFTVLPDGSTLSQWAAPQLDHALSSKQMPGLLPGAGPIPLEGRRS